MRANHPVGGVEKFLIKYPVVLIPLFGLIGSLAYGLPLSAMLWLTAPLDGDSLAWVAMIWGLLGIFIVPRSFELSLTTLQFVSLLFFAQGAVLGFVVGFVAMFIVQWKNFPGSATDKNE